MGTWSCHSCAFVALAARTAPTDSRTPRIQKTNKHSSNVGRQVGNGSPIKKAKHNDQINPTIAPYDTMPHQQLHCLLAVLCLLAAIALACTEDDHCMPSSCCHSNGCVDATKASPPNCTDVMCSAGCEHDTLDCGGECRCAVNTNVCVPFFRAGMPPDGAGPWAVPRPPQMKGSKVIRVVRKSSPH